MAVVSIPFIQSSGMRPKRAAPSPSPADSRKVELIIIVGRVLFNGYPQILDLARGCP